jgi:TRAP-type C4-dicarboxylate transport system substrate-binding protein
MRSRILPTGLAAAMTVTLALSACSAGKATDKTGGDSPPLVLTAVSPEDAERPTGKQLAAVAAAIDRLSGGRVTMQVTYGIGPDQGAIEQLRAKKAALGIVASRAFSSEGVNSFKALTAPFLIQSDAAATAVATDRAITEPMLAGVSAVGLTGLGIYPETLRHPFSPDAPVLTPADLRGKKLRSLEAEETYAAFRALGAEPMFADGAEFRIGLTSGDIAVVESSFALARSVIPVPTIGTGNVTFFPRMNVLVANAEAMSGLTKAQQDMVRKAVEEARGPAQQAMTPDAEAARAFCAEGGRVVLASPEQMAKLQQAATPYLGQLSAEPVTAAVIQAIRKTVAAVPAAAPVTACGTAKVASQPQRFEPWPVAAAGTPLDGKYRVEVTDEMLAAAGVPRSGWLEDHGTYTWTISGGRMAFEMVAPNPVARSTNSFKFAVRGNKVMVFDEGADNDTPRAQDVLFVGTWHRAADGSLTFTDQVPGLDTAQVDQAVWFSSPFTPLK